MASHSVEMMDASESFKKHCTVLYLYLSVFHVPFKHLLENLFTFFSFAEPNTCSSSSGWAIGKRARSLSLSLSLFFCIRQASVCYHFHCVHIAVAVWFYITKIYHLINFITFYYEHPSPCSLTSFISMLRIRCKLSLFCSI